MVSSARNGGWERKRWLLSHASNGRAWPGSGPEWGRFRPKPCQDGSILAHGKLCHEKNAVLVYASSTKRTASTRPGPFLGTVFFFGRGRMMLIAAASSCVFKCAA